MTDSILVINAGSSSIKYELIEVASEKTFASGRVERIGEPEPKLLHNNNSHVTEQSVSAADHQEAMTQILAAFAQLGPQLDSASVRGVGHRVVMGGPDFERAVVISDEVLETIERLAPLAPLHNPANAAAIRVSRAHLSEVPHVAVFDTAFFHDLPAEASTYAIDRQLAEQNSIRRYGFHGISHEYVSTKVAEMIRHTNPSALRQIVLHLGNGASASAVVGSHPVDTSMGFTPLEGLVMGTRSGDIDPSVAFYLCRNGEMSIDEVDDILNHRSGMQGLTGCSDMRDVHRRIDEGDEAARLGLSVYVRRLQKYVGAYAAVMGGLDAVTFTAGVGENDPVVREGTVSRLGFLGLEIDRARNSADDDGPRIISSDGSRVVVLVVPTREELSIARQVAALI